MGPSALVPVTIRTDPMSVSARIPGDAEERERLVAGEGGHGKTPSELPLTSKYWIVVPGRSTSEKTAPNPRTSAGAVPFVPGTEKKPSVTLPPMGATSRLGLKGAEEIRRMSG